MLRVFSPSDTDFTSNGDVVIQATLAVVHKVDNGDYFLELQCGLEYVDFVKSENIIVAPTPQGAQAFRIENVELTRTKISVKAWHKFYDSKNYLIADSYVVDKNCNDALDHLNSATDNESPFTTLSDVQTVASYRCVRKSLYEAINTVLERWGGHLVRDKTVYRSVNQSDPITALPYNTEKISRISLSLMIGAAYVQSSYRLARTALRLITFTLSNNTTYLIQRPYLLSKISTRRITRTRINTKQL